MIVYFPLSKNTQDLPEELQEEVLFSLRQPRDLYRACSASSSQRRICSGLTFWKAKFAREGLPLLEEGNNLASWLDLYNRALQAAQLADEELVNLENLPNLSYLPGLEEVLQPYYKVKSGENVEHIVRQVRAADEPAQEIEIRDDYFVFLVPTEEGGHRYEVTERRIFPDGILTRDHSRILYASSIMNSEQAWKILYRLFYFGVLF